MSGNEQKHFDINGKTILLVEDEALIAMDEAMILRQYGYTVVTASSGEKAIRTVQEKVIDLILMDIDLGRGRIDGTKTAQRILQEHNLPIIFLTSHSEKETVDKVKGITRYGYVLKNSGEFVLMESISMAFELFEANRKMEAEYQERRQAETALKESLQMSDNIVHAIPSGLFIYQFREPDKLYLLAGNPESERITGLTVQSSIGKELNDLWLNANATGLRDAFLGAFLTGKTFKTEDLYYEDARLAGAFRIRAFKMPGDQLGVIFDNVTELKKAERELRKNRKLLDSIVENIPTMVFVKESKNLTFTLLNKAVESFLGIPRNEMIGKNDYSFFPQEEADFFTQKDREALDGGRLLVVPEEEIKTAYGKRKIYTKKVPIPGDNGEPGYLLGIAEDITKRLKAEKELQESEEKFRSVVQMARDAIVVSTFDDIIIFWNDEAERIFGYSSDEIVGERVETIVPERFHEHYRTNLLRRREFGRDAVSADISELCGRRKDGSDITVERSVAAWEANDQVFVTRVYRDIRQRRQALQALYESEKKYYTLFNAANDAIFIADAETGIIIDANKKAEELMGRPRQDIIGRHQSEMHPKEQEEYARALFKTSCTPKKRMIHKEFEVMHKDGHHTPVEICSSIITIENRSVIQGIFRDITERKKSEDALRKSNEELEGALREREFLLRETNHRVKNNLAMINAFIRLKGSSLGNSVDLSDLEHRINTIQIVHEKLYMGNEISRIDFRLYIQELLKNIFSSFSGHYVKLTNTIRTLSLDTKTAVSLGLIINEIATNAIKHGFPSDREAEFTVDMHRDKQRETYIFTIANSGCPFPESVDQANTKTLGLQIINMLVEQMEGTIEIKKKPHPVFTLRIPESTIT